MSYEPIMDGRVATNVDGEHTFKIRATFGASSAVTYRSKDATMAKAGTGQWTITLPKPYAEITKFSCGWFRADSQTTLSMQLVTISDVGVGGTVTIEALGPATGTATDPASGDVAYIEIGVSVSTVNDHYTGTG